MQHAGTLTAIELGTPRPATPNCESDPNLLRRLHIPTPRLDLVKALCTAIGIRVLVCAALPDARASEMPAQRRLPFGVPRRALAQLLQRVAHEQLVVARREERGRHVDQDRDPAVVVVAEGAAAEENGRDAAAAQVARQVRRDGDVGEAPVGDEE